MKPQILFIDDDVELLDALRRRLRKLSGRWLLSFLDGADEAWRRLQQETVSAVVCDIRMPGLNGFDLLQRMSESDRTRGIPVVMLCGLDDDALRQESLKLGAIDLIPKPIDCSELVARLEYMVQLKAMHDELDTRVSALAGVTSDDSYVELDIGDKAPYLTCLYRIAQHCDGDLGNHIIRIGWYSREIAARLGLDHDQQERLFWAAPLHDIGKLGIPEKILKKRGKLTPGEWCIIRRHCAIGETMLRGHATDVLAIYEASDPAAVLNFGADPLLSTAAMIALTHHEKWNGSGYPLGLAGPRIPLESRIVMVADVFDSMISQQSYHGPTPMETARQWIGHLRGQFFDPAVVDAFEKSFESIRMIHDLLAHDVALDYEAPAGDRLRASTPAAGA